VSLLSPLPLAGEGPGERVLLLHFFSMSVDIADANANIGASIFTFAQRPGALPR
jgi:hypothetical protein